MSTYTSERALDIIALARDKVMERAEPVVLVTVVRAKGSSPQRPGARLLLFPNGETEGTVGGGLIESIVLKDARKILEEDGNTGLYSYNLLDIGMTCGGSMDFFLERIDPSPHLVIFGGGHVAKPTASLASQMGFRVTVVDERVEWASKARFPNVTIFNQTFDDFIDELQPHSNHYFVVMTQGHALDEVVLVRIIGGAQRYTGVIGSRRKAIEMGKSLQSKGITKEQWEEIHCPIGLPIGGDTPEEIAMSIVSQLVQVRNES